MMKRHAMNQANAGVNISKVFLRRPRLNPIVLALLSLPLVGLS